MRYRVATDMFSCYWCAMRQTEKMLSMDHHPADWRHWMVDPIIPPGERGETRPLSIAFPKAMLQRIDKIAKDTHNNRSDTIRYLLRWALEAYEKSRAAEKGTDSAA